MRTQSLRSWLTIIGIILGILTIVTILSISGGVRKDIDEQLSVFGADNLIVIPVNVEKRSLSFMGMSRMASTGRLFERDVDLIENTPGVKMVSRMVYGKTTVQFRDKSITSMVYGADANMLDIFGGYMEIEEGRMFRDGEKYVVVLGYDAAHDLFGDYDIKVNNKLIINGKKFRVVGIFKKIGTPMSEMDDKSITIPYDAAKEIFSNRIGKNEVSAISIKVEEGYDVSEVSELLEEKIAASHKVPLDDKDFSIIGSEFINKTVGSIMDTLSAFLLIIAVISAVVGGIGISNTMFMSVIERTREIGTLKALGATSTDILSLFLIEAGLVGGIGGVIGILLGIIITYIISVVGGINVVYDWPIYLGALIFSTLVGIVSGVIPAYNASKIPAIEALRY